MHEGQFTTDYLVMTFLHKASLGKLKTKKGRQLLGYNQSIPSAGARDIFFISFSSNKILLRY